MLTIYEAEKILQKFNSTLFEFISKENSFGVLGNISSRGVSIQLLRTYLNY